MDDSGYHFDKVSQKHIQFTQGRFRRGLTLKYRSAEKAKGVEKAKAHDLDLALEPQDRPSIS